MCANLTISLLKDYKRQNINCVNTVKVSAVKKIKKQFQKNIVIEFKSQNPQEEVLIFLQLGFSIIGVK